MNGREGPPRSRAEPDGSRIPTGQDRRQKRRLRVPENPSSRLASQVRRLAKLTTAGPPAAKDSFRKTLQEVQP
jgi:hypothetical protein